MSLSRREFLKHPLKGLGQDFQDAEPSSDGALRPARNNAIPIHRPPGAVSEPKFLAGCTKCDKCIEVCPYDAIIHAPPRYREAVGTPMIVPAESPCRMCADMPCIAACPERVLSPDAPVRMGEARIQTMHCLAFQGSFCSSCAERCPVPGAVEMIDGKPVIHPEACTGCGVCFFVCPAPINAIIVLPDSW